MDNGCEKKKWERVSEGVLNFNTHNIDKGLFKQNNEGYDRTQYDNDKSKHLTC